MLCQVRTDHINLNINFLDEIHTHIEMLKTVTSKNVYLTTEGQNGIRAQSCNKGGASGALAPRRSKCKSAKLKIRKLK
jgi:hypothetical protein